MQYKIVVDKQPMTNPSSEKKEYIIDIEELRAKGSTHDSLMFEIDKTYVIRRLKLSEYYVLSVLDEPIIEALESINIELFEGDNYIYLIDMQGNKFYAEYLIKNDFNDVFATRKEMNSAIDLTMQQITIAVNQKFTDYSTTEEMNAAIDLRANQINAEVEKKVDEETITGAYLILKINGDTSGAKLNADKIEISANDILNLLAGNTINLTSKNLVLASTNFNVDKNGNMTCSNANISGTITSSNANITGGSIKVGNNFTVNSSGNMTCNNGIFNGGKVDLIGGTEESSFFNIYKDLNRSNINRFYATNNKFGIFSGNYYRSIRGEATEDGTTLFIGADENNYITNTVFGSGFDFASTNWHTSDSRTQVDAYQITTPKLTQTSLENIKKNINKFTKDATAIINNSDIYEYNLKSDKDTDKKMIGFVIGEEYKTPSEVISKEGQAVELYSAIGILWKAVQELSARVEQIEKEARYE